MVYSILSESRVEASTAELGARRPYSVFWAENRNLQGWTTFVNMDIVGAWGGFLFGTKTTTDGSFIGPSNPFVPVDALENGHILFRMKYDRHPKNPNPTTFGKIQWTTVADPLFNEDKSITFVVLPDGKWHLYDLNMNSAPNWVGQINQIRFFPCENGYRNDEFFLNFFEIGDTDFTFGFENERAGLPGRVVGAVSLTTELQIQSGVNDRLIVNIDGYGDVQITLTAQRAQPETIARDISLQLGKIAIGGYVRAQARIEDETRRMIIESGTRDADSSVRVSFGNHSAAALLGFTSPDGVAIGTEISGTAPAIDYTPASAYRPTTLELLSLFDKDVDLPAFSMNTQAPLVEGGRRDFALTNQKLVTEVLVEGRGTNHQGQRISTQGSLDLQGKTVIDITHPFTDDGKIDFIYFNGISNTSGGTKWKIFRPQLDGSLQFVAEGVIGQTTITPNPAGGLVLTQSPGVFIADVSAQNVRVRRGDLLGIYNCRLHVGSFGTLKPDAMYYEYDGDVTSTTAAKPPTGAGEAGLPLYAHSRGTKTQAIVDIDLRRRSNIDQLQVTGEESVNDLEYNLAAASSASFSADVKGDHTICYVFDLITGARTCFSRPNTAFNLQALNDNVIYANNGITSFGSPGEAGLGGADVAGSTYFYVNGDAEHLGVFEFQGRAPAAYNFMRDPLGIDVFFGSETPRLDKPIGKAVIYFKDKKNQRSWQIEYMRPQGGQGGNGSKSGFHLIDESTIRAVELDDKRIEQEDVFFATIKTTAQQNLLLRNPVVLDVIANDGTRNPQLGQDFSVDAGQLGGVNTRDQATFIEFQWNRFAWEFDPIRASAFRWYTDFHWSTKITEFQVFGTSRSQEALGDNVQVLFSHDGETFATAELIRASSTNAEYKIANSPQYLRLIFRPTVDLTLKDIDVRFEDDQVCFGEEGRLEGAMSVSAAVVGAPGDSTPLQITNRTGQIADLLLDLPPDTASARQLMYFSRLSSQADVDFPQVGPPGRVDFDLDKRLLEVDNVAINAKSYGLLPLAAPLQYSTTPELLANGTFETGNLAGWNLTITQSGTKRYQVPRVMDIATPGSLDFDTVTGFQTGQYVFGFSLDNQIPEQQHGTTTPGPDEIPIHFSLSSEIIDISEHAESVDLNTAKVVLAFRYLTYFTPTAGSPRIIILGAPTLSGINLSPNSVVDSAYGTNTLRSRILEQSSTVNTQSGVSDQIEISEFLANLKPNTRFIRILLEVSANGARTAGTGGNTIRREKFLLDNVSVKLRLAPTGAVQWYKSWRAGAGDFTDASFAPVTEFTTITGSSHWWQPFVINAAGTPQSGQNPGYSMAFLGDRRFGVHSFRRMVPHDAGILGAQWSGEKLIWGLRIILGHVTGSITSSCGYAHKWHLEVLRTKMELGGVDPDINNPAHFKLAKAFVATGPYDNADSDLLGENVSALAQAPAGRILTWKLDEPLWTEGMRIVFTGNCDRWEVLAFNGTTSVPIGQGAAFNALTACPNNTPGAPALYFTCTLGLGISFFQPLEVAGIRSLPVDNVRDRQHSGNIFAAVDLGRRHAIETNTDLFELVSDTDLPSEWNTTGVVFSNSNTNDPNAVVWGNTGPSDARWIRFTSTSTEKYEDPASLMTTSQTTTPVNTVMVINVPQATIQKARIYPDIRTSLIPTQGLNSQWQDLGTTLTDNDNSTFINYTDYPVIAVDLGRPYLLSNESTVFRKKHDLVSYRPLADPSDRYYWNPDLDANFTYSSSAFQSESNPSKVQFLSYGTTPPNIPVRWVAFKGNGPARANNNPSGPKRFLLYSAGGNLFNTAWRPRNPESWSENFSWFTTRKSGLRDISTFRTDSGNQFSAIKGIDYGANADNLGDAYFAFDGRFDELEGDVWGVALRDVETGLISASRNFPHKIFRVFRDLFRGNFQAKSIRAIKIKGYNEAFYPSSFTIQRLRDSVVLSTVNSEAARNSNIETLRLDTSWEDIPNTSFTGVNTFQQGIGFTVVFPQAISTRGIRLVISASQYVDDTVQTQLSDTGTNTFNTFVNTSGPETRVSEIVLYEEQTEEAVVTGEVHNNRSLLAAVSSNTSVPARPPSLVKDGRVDTFWQSAGFQDRLVFDFPNPTTVTRLEWEKDPALGQASGNLSTNAPQDFQLKALVGVSEVVLLEEADFTGTSYARDLDTPVISTRFILEVTRVQGQNENASAIQLSEVRLIERVVQETPLVVIEESVERHSEQSPNLRSTRIRYAPSASSSAVIVLDGVDANNDPLFSERDFFQFYLKINDVSLLDLTTGRIRLGNSKEVYYEWLLSDLPPLVSGWNKIKLRFLSAADRSLKPFQGGANYDPEFGDSRVDFITGDIDVTTSVDGTTSSRVIESPGIRFFELVFQGTGGADELQLTLDDFQFVRNHFEDECQFGTSLYLNNSETLTLPLEGMDLATGTVEFWIQPDWDTAGRISRGISSIVIPAIFRIIRPDGKFLSLFYRPGTGFTTMIYDGSQLLQFESSFPAYRFERYETFHFALAWDVRGRASREGATLAMYVNGQPIYGSQIPWRALRESGASVIIGGELGQRFAANPHNVTALTFTPVPTLPAKNTASTWALLENLKIYNYAKWDFSDRVNSNLTTLQSLTPSQLIELSLDGTTFEQTGSDNLPLVVEDVPPNGEVTVFVRTILPSNLPRDISRDASLLVRWKARDQQCN